MENYIGKICPFCKTTIEETSNVKVCTACGIPHHAECWEENHGCTTFGCSEQQYQPREVSPTEVCENCGAVLEEGHVFCPKCGHKNGLGVDNHVKAALEELNTRTESKNKMKSKKPIIIGAIVAGIAILIILIVVATGDKGPDFKKIYNQYCSSTWASYGADGSYLKLDTNPYDWDDEGAAYMEAFYAIEDINKALGLPDSLAQEMKTTTYNDGKQTEVFGKITVSWKYHPDTGLEVTYKKTN